MQQETRRGRPRSEEKHARILEAAAAVFRDEGFAASMDRIAALAGVSKQTVYGHFGSKEELYRAMNSRIRWFTHDMLTAEPPVGEVLTRFATAMLTKLTAPDTVAVHRLMIAQAAAFPDLARLQDELGPARSLAALGDYLAARMDEGRLRRDEPRAAAELFMGMVQGLTRQRLLLGAIDPLDDVAVAERVRRAVEVFVRAYRPD